MELKATQVTREPQRGRWRKTRIYIWPHGETIMGNLLDRRNRPLGAFRTIAQQVLKEYGAPDAKIYWSQRAGCSCPCSPGFIVTHPGYEGFDLHVTVEGYEPRHGEADELRVASQLNNLEAVTL